MTRLRIRPQQRPIVVGEDNYLTARLIAAALARANHTVVIARDGDEVLALVDRYGPELLLLNLSISRPSGTFLLRHFQQQRPDLRVIAFSCAGQPEMRQTAQGVGVPFFETPFHPMELADKVRIVLTAHQS